MGDVVAADGARGGGEGAGSGNPSSDGSRVVHVDCERCRSRLEVRVPLALQLADRGATVGAARATPSFRCPSRGPPGPSPTFRTRTPTRIPTPLPPQPPPPRSASANRSSRRAPRTTNVTSNSRYHMDMAQQHSHAGRSNPAPVSASGPTPTESCPIPSSSLRQRRTTSTGSFEKPRATFGSTPRPRNPPNAHVNLANRPRTTSSYARRSEAQGARSRTEPQGGVQGGGEELGRLPLNTRSAAYDPASAGGFGGGGRPRAAGRRPRSREARGDHS